VSASNGRKLAPSHLRPRDHVFGFQSDAMALEHAARILRHYQHQPGSRLRPFVFGVLIGFLNAYAARLRRLTDAPPRK
jgi:hypothetical protein